MVGGFLFSFSCQSRDERTVDAIEWTRELGAESEDLGRWMAVLSLVKENLEGGSAELLK